MPTITDRAPLPSPPTAKVAPAPHQAPKTPPSSLQTPQKQPSTSEGQTTSTEAPAADPSAQDALSPKFAALAKREKAIKDKDDWLKKEQEKLKAEREEIRKQAQAELRAKIKADPWGMMAEEGLTAEQLLTLQGQQPNPNDQKLSTLEQKIAQLEKDKIEAQQSQYQAARKQALADVSRIVQSSDAFEVVKALGLEEQVVAKIEDTYKQSGTLPEYETACKEVEEEFFPMALEIAKLAKIQKALQPPQAEEAEIPEQQPAAMKPDPSSQKPAPAMTTLSNRQTPTSGKALSWAERRARAIAVAEGRAV